MTKYILEIEKTGCDDCPLRYWVPENNWGDGRYVCVVAEADLDFFDKNPKHFECPLKEVLE